MSGETREDDFSSRFFYLMHGGIRYLSQNIDRKELKVAYKGQLISKANCQAVNSSKKRTNEFIFTSMQRFFVCFSEEIEDSEKAFRNYLTFR